MRSGRINHPKSMKKFTLLIAALAIGSALTHGQVFVTVTNSNGDMIFTANNLVPTHTYCFETKISLENPWSDLASFVPGTNTASMTIPVFYVPEYPIFFFRTKDLTLAATNKTP